MNNIRPYREWFPQFDESVFIDPSAQVIGRTTIGSDSSIWPLVAVRGDVNCIEIGQRTNIQDNSVLHVARPTEENAEGFALIIGDEVTVGHGAILHACTIGDRCLIGMAATVMDGATIGAETILAAGSLVPPGKTLEGGYLYRGSPAKQARPLSEAERAWLKESADHYVRLKDEYLSTAQREQST
jgi:carbonic anhydrase/acetyltransferase-like protein (isoleucine patch superfamily)